MSHTPPVPGDAVSPYPLKAAQSAARETARHDLAAKAAIAAPPAPNRAGTAIAAAAAAVLALAAMGVMWSRRDTSRVRP